MFGKPAASGERPRQRSFKIKTVLARRKTSTQDAHAPWTEIPRSTLDVERSLVAGGRYRLHLVPQTLLVPMRPHSLATLVLGDFCFSSFFERAHLDFQNRRLRFNHLTRRSATAIGGDLAMYCRTLQMETQGGQSQREPPLTAIPACAYRRGVWDE